MANKKLKVRGNYRKMLGDGIGTQLANYEVEVVVAEVRPDFIRDAVQAVIPSKVVSYESLQTCYPQHDTITDTDDQLTVDLVRGGFDPNYGAPVEKREVGANQGMDQIAAEAGTEELRQAAQEQANEGDANVEVGDTIPTHPEPGKTYEAPATGDFSQAETITPDGTIPAGGTEPVADADDKPPVPAAQ